MAATAAITRGAAAAAAAPATGASCGLLPPERIGLQLYSVATTIQDSGFEAVLSELAEIGYKQVEFAGYKDNTGIGLEDLKGLLDANGLVAVGSHVDAGLGDIEKTLDDAQVLGVPQIGASLVLPDGPPTVSGWAAQAENFNRYGEACAKRGMRFYMHNHFEEWLPAADDPNQRGMDVLLAETDPKLVDWQCDIFWIYVGKAQSLLKSLDPLKDYILPQRDRIKLFHVKDGTPQNAGILDVGEGEIEFQSLLTELFAASKNERNKHMYLWERDSADDHPRGAMAAARASFVNMRYGLVNDGKCKPAKAGLKAMIAGTTVRDGRLRVKVKLNRAATVTATLTRAGKRITRTKRLGKGNRTLTLKLPAGTGTAKLQVTVSDGTGTKLVLRDTVAL